MLHGYLSDYTYLSLKVEVLVYIIQDIKSPIFAPSVFNTVSRIFELMKNFMALNGITSVCIFLYPSAYFIEKRNYA